MEAIKFTVVVPTRERCDVLKSTLKTVLAQDYENLEIIVSDNFSADDTREHVLGLDDTRVRYVNPGRRLSMSHHWEFALDSIGSKGWLTILGDDDGLLPNALHEVSDLIATHSVEAIRSMTCGYKWPTNANGNLGELEVPLRRGVEVRDSTIWLKKVLDGRAPYTELPILYSGGFVSIAMIRKLRLLTNTVYRSCIPDVYSAVALSKITSEYLYSFRPFAINGASKHSTGTSQFRVPAASSKSNVKVDGDTPANKFLSEDNIPFHSDIPMGPSGEYPKSLHAMIYESHLQSLDLGRGFPERVHSRQLAVALKRAGRHREDVEIWGRRFAGLHGLNYEVIRKSVRNRQVFQFIRQLPSEISLIFFSCRVRSPVLPMRDVFEASVVSAAILETRPGFLRRTLRNIKNRYNSLRTRAI